MKLEQCAVGVAQVVQADDRDAGAAGDSLEGLRESVGVDGSAVAVGKDPPVAVDTNGGELGGPECLHPASTVSVVSSRSMGRRALRVLPRVWWSS